MQLKMKTVSQAFQLFVVVVSVVIQYYWFIQNKSPIQLYHETKDRILSEFLFKNTSTPIIPSSNDQETSSPIDSNHKLDDEIKQTQPNEPLLSNLILYEFEETLKHFKYNQYPQRSTMYLQFWTLFFETLSNHYCYQQQK